MNWLRNKQKITGKDLQEMLKRVERAYGILEVNSQEPVIFESSSGELFSVMSCTNKKKFYTVDNDIKTCTCPDFNFRFMKCKHIIATEFASSESR